MYIVLFMKLGNLFFLSFKKNEIGLGDYHASICSTEVEKIVLLTVHLLQPKIFGCGCTDKLLKWPFIFLT